MICYMKKNANVECITIHDMLSKSIVIDVFMADKYCLLISYLAKMNVFGKFDQVHLEL